MWSIFDFFDTIFRVNDQAKQALQEIIREKTYSKNEIIQAIGSRCRTIYFVKSGGARIFYYKDGTDITEHFAFDNDLIVRAESLFTGNPTSKGIQAIDATRMLAIDSEKLFHLYDQHHDLERLFRLIFEREYVNTVKRLESLQFKSAKERYLELLDTTDFVQKIPLKYIASYLGITPVSLSRIRAGID
ncbi:Crp/Fnr family transcriptional regulator [Cyclobacterium plantarum]|uniref:Crp/Fnr family transcriptional regulator n=1 Tax=Cyclobacterium plantarum TaxID=2716263 RepID=A0ABX0H4V9_9BACT|nr:Crp/Fnr family transcriptional regulator [Cyclobacterium plantarum]NHE56871.1 Crp/Fnr family transcriptional regulator [Cyclobacterium plantarum]